MKISEPLDGVLHIEFDNRLELTMSMYRFEEYYESPFPNIKGHVFGLEEFVSTYAKPTGKLTYFKEWDGFNVPKSFMDSFINDYINEKEVFSKREQCVIEIWQKKDYKYIIATEPDSDSTTLPHELSHAKFSLNQQYKDATLDIINKIPTDIKELLRQGLINNGYMDNDTLIDDEIHAYLRTSDEEEFEEMFPTISIDVLFDLQKKFLEVN
jgi:hypothetical protein